MEKLVYHYNENKVYTATTPAHNDPIANPDRRLNGVWLLPASATFIAPPEIPSDKLAQFDDVSESWSLIDKPNYVDPSSDARFVVWYRNIEGMDTAIGGGEYRRNMVPQGETEPRLNGRLFTDPAISAYGFHVFDEKPEIFSVKNVNSVETKKFDTVSMTIVDRDEIDILVDDPEDQRVTSVVIYRKKDGFENKVVLVKPWSEMAKGKVVYYNGKPITDVENQFYRHLVFKTLPEGADAIYQGEVYRKAYDEATGEFVARSEESMARDPKRAPSIKEGMDVLFKEILLEKTGVDMPMSDHLIEYQRAIDVLRDPLAAIVATGVDFVAGVYQIVPRDVTNISIGDSVYGEGIAPDTVVTEIVDVNTTILSRPTTDEVLGSIVTFDPTPRLNAMAMAYRAAFNEIAETKRLTEIELSKLELE